MKPWQAALLTFIVVGLALDSLTPNAGIYAALTTAIVYGLVKWRSSRLPT